MTSFLYAHDCVLASRVIPVHSIIKDIFAVIHKNLPTDQHCTA